MGTLQDVAAGVHVTVTEDRPEVAFTFPGVPGTAVSIEQFDGGLLGAATETSDVRGTLTADVRGTLTVEVHPPGALGAPR
jgi:hypothetical protein